MQAHFLGMIFGIMIYLVIFRHSQELRTLRGL